jgi:outer membrane receptor protein involved in Fe transport
MHSRIELRGCQLRGAPLSVAIAAALASVGAPATVGAQETQQGEDVLVVTGTRIVQQDFNFANPIVSVEASDIEDSGQTNITTFLTEIPALSGSLDSFDSGGSDAFVGGAGINLLDLRYLGFDRTLVLVDARRHVASLAESAAVDISTIPVDLIERVDVLTGGASAIYGADGVTGVVNFVLRDDFEGLTVRAQTNAPEQTGAERSILALTYGHNYADDRGNVTVAIERSTEERLYGYDRDFNGSGRGIFTRLARNPADTSDPPVGDGGTDDPNVPDRLPFDLTAFGDSSRAGAIYTEFLNFPSPEYDGDGTPWDFGELPPQTIGGFPDFPISPFFQIAGDATLQDDYLGYSTILPEIDRTAFNVFFKHEFSDRVELFSEVKYVASEVSNLSQPSFDFFLFLDQANPFIPAALQGVPMPDGGLYVSRDHIDMGIRGDEIERETERIVLGVRGEATSWADYDVSFVWGSTTVTADQTNNRFNDRFFAALDVIDNGGVPDCRVNVDPTSTPADFPDPITYTPGDGTCEPLNLFGDGAPSAQAIDWIMNTTTAVDEIEQRVLSGYLTGDVGSLPAGPISWAFGGEYREESSESRPDPFETAGATFGNVILPNSGEFDVKEVFGELNLPLLTGKTGAQDLSLDAAFRYSDYSTIGSTNTWELGAQWAPIQAVTFRATVAEAVRAPNIAEVFGAENQTFEFIVDPCDVGEVPTGTQYRQANCAAILTPFGIDPNAFVDPNSSSVAGVSSGNPNIREESADTRTIGIVFRPSFAEGLTFAIDYYDIELKDAVQTVGPEEIAERCVDAPTLANDFCPLIDRDPTTGAIESFRLVPVNLAALETSGFDFTLSYMLDASDAGSFNFRLIGNKLEKLDFLPSAGGVVDDDVGEGPDVSFAEQPVPELQATFDVTWERGPLSVNYGFQWFDETQRISNRNLNGDTDLVGGDRDFIPAEYYYFDNKLTHDVHLRYTTNRSISIYGGVNNLTDEGPAFDQVFHPVSPVGRAYYVGIRADLGGS